MWLDSTRLPSRRAATSKEELDGWLTIRLRCLSLFRLSPLRFPQLRAAQYAKEQGYAILLDSDIEWTYVNMAEVSPRSSFGRIGNRIIIRGEGNVLEQTGKSLTPSSVVICRQYLLPHRLDCVPRPEWRTRERTAVGSEGWQHQPHLRTSRNEGMWEIEAHVRPHPSPYFYSNRLLTVHATLVAQMRTKYKRPENPGEVDDDPSHHHHEPSALLPAEMTLMPGYKDLFLSLSSVVKDLWRPTEIISLQVDELVAKHRLRERLSVGVHSEYDRPWRGRGADTDTVRFHPPSPHG